MTLLESMATACVKARQQQRNVALITVTEADGSTFRRPGARMLVYGDGTKLGQVSGGCLDGDIFTRASKVMLTGNPAYARYGVDTENGDLLIESGCNGTVGILIEDALDPGVSTMLSVLADAENCRDAGVLATVYLADRSTGVCPGSRVYCFSGRDFAGDTHILPIIPSLQEVFWHGFDCSKSRSVNYELPGGNVRVLIEPIVPPPALLVCGSGDDAAVLVRMATGVGWHVHAAEDRPNLLSSSRFPGVRTLLPFGPESREITRMVDNRTAAIVMTHSYTHDLKWLRGLIHLPVNYLGILGPRKRSERIFTQLRSEGTVINGSQMEKLYTPTGLDIGSETPEEIAIAIIAEIQAVMNGRSGGCLRDRASAIHQQNPPELSSNAPSREIKDARCPVLA